MHLEDKRIQGTITVELPLIIKYEMGLQLHLILLWNLNTTKNPENLGDN